MSKKQVELGDRVKDRVSGLEGIAVSYTRWIHGCLRWAVQPSVGKDNKKMDAEWVDDPIRVIYKGMDRLEYRDQNRCFAFL